jgi:hypothetical protein
MIQVRLVPRGWEEFQHYKNRCPPWIKLHRDLLNDRVFMRLPTASKALAPLLWLLASESANGEFDGSIDELEFRLRMPASEITLGLKALIDNGFFIVASGVLAACLRVAIPEGEGEGETEGETEQSRRASKAPATGLQTACRDTWAAYSSAYADRYLTPPVRNVKTNALIKRFCQLLPAEESPAVAEHYVQHNAQWYVQKMHPVEVMVADAQKLRTEWKTGSRMTTTRARQIDATGSMADIVAEIQRERGGV